MKTFINNKPIQNIHFNSVYINPGLKSILQALEVLKNRQKVLLVFENDLERNDQFIFTRTFPFFLFEIPALNQEFKILQSVIKLAPHLFQPQKVLYLSKTQPSKITIRLADYWYKNKYQNKSEVWIPEQMEKLAFVRKTFHKSIYFQEYRYNISRLIIELLKYFESKGGTIKINYPVKAEKNKLTSLQTKETTTSAKIFNCSTKKTTNYRFQIEYFPDICIVYRDSKLIFRYTNHKETLRAEPLNTVSEKTSEQKILAITQSLFLQKIEKISKTERIENPTTETLKKLTELIQLPLGCSFEKAGLSAMNEQCLEKYDLAKQTGISYAGFKILFHRYGSGIDEIIEDAYSYMNKIRNPEKIWNFAEKNYQKKNEWSI